MGWLEMWLVPAEKNWMSLVEGMEEAFSGSQKRVARYFAFLLVSAWTLVDVDQSNGVSKGMHVQSIWVTPQDGLGNQAFGIVVAQKS